MSTTVTKQVSASADDCVVIPSASYLATNITYQIAGNLLVLPPSIISEGGMRFQTMAVPRHATIESAYLKLKGQALAGTAKTIIYGEDADDTATFSTYADYAARTLTTTNIAWEISAFVDGTWYDSPDIKDIIQEIVNRSGWKKGNNLVIFWKDNGSGDDSYALADSYDTLAADAPQLEITYSGGDVDSNFLIML
jgi:hypothetical protein